MAYSNYGVAMAAYMVEVKSGQPYVNEHIFKTLDMKETKIHPSHQESSRSCAKKRYGSRVYAYVNLSPSAEYT